DPEGVLTFSQRSPPSRLLHSSPSSVVSAYTVPGVPGAIVSRRTVAFSGRPADVDVQLWAPSLLLNTPPSMRATNSMATRPGSLARWAIATGGRVPGPLASPRPAFMACHVAPASVLFSTPPRTVPTYSVVGVAGSSTRPLIPPVTGNGSGLQLVPP